MLTERFTDKSDDELRRLCLENKEIADTYRSMANRLMVQVGEYKVELDRRAAEKLLNVGDKVLKPDGTIEVVIRIGNYSAGLDYMIADLGQGHIDFNEAVVMRHAYLASLKEQENG